MEPPKMKIVRITREPVELYKVLKFENLAASGGEAKFLIAHGRVTVNGQTETRKRRKLYSGDVIGFEHILLRIEVEQDPEDL